MSSLHTGWCQSGPMVHMKHGAKWELVVFLLVPCVPDGMWADFERLFFAHGVMILFWLGGENRHSWPKTVAGNKKGSKPGQGLEAATKRVSPLLRLTVANEPNVRPSIGLSLDISCRVCGSWRTEWRFGPCPSPSMSLRRDADAILSRPCANQDALNARHTTHDALVRQEKPISKCLRGGSTSPSCLSAPSTRSPLSLLCVCVRSSGSTPFLPLPTCAVLPSCRPSCLPAASCQRPVASCQLASCQLPALVAHTAAALALARRGRLAQTCTSLVQPAVGH